MTTTDTHVFDLTLDGLVYLEDVLCEFEVETDEYPAEPYAWGGSRGTETDVSATLLSAKIGGLVLVREQVLLMFGPEAVLRAESAACDAARERIAA